MLLQSHSYVCVACVGIGLAMGWSPVYGFIPVAYKFHGFGIENRPIDQLRRCSKQSLYSCWLLHGFLIDVTEQVTVVVMPDSGGDLFEYQPWHPLHWRFSSVLLLVNWGIILPKSSPVHHSSDRHPNFGRYVRLAADSRQTQHVNSILWISVLI
jgi:hypothetical protein